MTILVVRASRDAKAGGDDDDDALGVGDCLPRLPSREVGTLYRACTTWPPTNSTFTCQSSGCTWAVRAQPGRSVTVSMGDTTDAGWCLVCHMYGTIFHNEELPLGTYLGSSLVLT